MVLEVIFDYWLCVVTIRFLSGNPLVSYSKSLVVPSIWVGTIVLCFEAYVVSNVDCNRFGVQVCPPREACTPYRVCSISHLLWLFEAGDASAAD